MVAKAIPFIIEPNALDLIICNGMILKQIAISAIVLWRLLPVLLLTSSISPCSVNRSKIVSMAKYPKIGTMTPIRSPMSMLLFSLSSRIIVQNF